MGKGVYELLFRVVFCITKRVVCIPFMVRINRVIDGWCETYV